MDIVPVDKRVIKINNNLFLIGYGKDVDESYDDLMDFLNHSNFDKKIVEVFNPNLFEEIVMSPSSLNTTLINILKKTNETSIFYSPFYSNKVFSKTTGRYILEDTNFTSDILKGEVLINDEIINKLNITSNILSSNLIKLIRKYQFKVILNEGKKEKFYILNFNNNKKLYFKKLKEVKKFLKSNTSNDHELPTLSQELKIKDDIPLFSINRDKIKQKIIIKIKHGDLLPNKKLIPVGYIFKIPN